MSIALNKRKALIVTYYLSKYDRKALEDLNYKSFSSAFKDIGKRLEINPNTIKNRRDDFDSIHDNHRSGWYQKELSRSSLEIVEKFESLSQDALTEIVKEILFNGDEVKDILAVLEGEEESYQEFTFNNRGVTGKRAEELFVEYFKKGFFKEFKGELIDTRDEGCGYDFKIKQESGIVFEIKGLSSEVGGVNFTDKEWKIAKKMKENYILVIISNVFGIPKFQVVANPYDKINPVKRISKVVSINWTFQSKGLHL
ncbi:DUF3883 domain-containing protein [Bacillus wiedmannii]|uniref:DUF3883 domain-containing protein n=1 Tax=Bacillus wiedmannii TaxID=1890302 RepID=UPI000863CD40|nr:DUF3883 domain-containing protein [Bacillus wiedmannii]SCN01536.1 Uncharacterized protein BCINRASA_00898 [Bacillus wiedmannii]